MQLPQFIGLLRQSNICPESQVDSLVATFQKECPNVSSGDDGIAQFCHLLVAANAATEWQCNKLKLGRWKGFYVDHYLLLEQDGKGIDYSSYRSRDVRDGTIVRLVVAPRVLSKGPDVEYRVEPLSG